MTAARALRLAAVAPLALLALLPVADWIPGGLTVPFYRLVLDEWWSGTLLVAGLGVVLALASRRLPALWREGTWTRIVDRLAFDRAAPVAILAAIAAALYAVVAWTVHSARPLLIDEQVQVWQARILASGHLWSPSTGHPELFGVTNVVDHGGKVFSQFPVGGPAMLALGSLVGAEWLVGPVFAALGLWWWGSTLRRTGEAPRSATGALLLLAFAPFAVFMSGSHMNHVTSLAWILAGMAGLAAVTTSPTPRPLAALASGLGFGLAATIRPVDAMAFGAPAGLWLFARALRDRKHLLECALAAVGMALPILAMCWVNAETTGHPFLFGYTLLWGPEHGLGFHQVPWGPAHTPLRGVELINLYLLQLQVRFLETPFPALLPALAVLAFGSRFRPFDRYLLISGAAILGAYWAYWHNGNFLGPRFVYTLLPVATLLTARFGSLLAERWGEGALPHRVGTYTVLVGGAIAIGVSVPIRVRQYSNGLLTSRFPVEQEAVTAGAVQGLVLVRESWGAQLITRMWGLGLPPATEELVYWNADMCKMERTIDSLERAGASGPTATSALVALAADSAHVIDSVLSVDVTERYLPGVQYDGVCRTRLAGDAAGFTVYPPLLFDDKSGNVYVHDQHARDTIALAMYPERPVFVLTPADTSLGALPHFHSAPRDSLLRAWGLPPDWRPAGAR